MLKSNTKIVKERIKNYIIEAFNYDDYDIGENASYNEICNLINDAFNEEVYKHHKGNRQDAFIYWCSGLPSIISTNYYYNVSAVDLLGDWLEETDEEKAKFNESKAAKLISSLLYREITSNAK